MAASTVARTAAPTETPSRPIKSWQPVDSCLPELRTPGRLLTSFSPTGLAQPHITESPVVLVYGETCGSRTAFLRHDPAHGETSWLTTDSEEWDITSQVTHWMPLPAVPKAAVAKVATTKATGDKVKAKRSTLVERATELATTETPAARTAARKASAQRQATKGTTAKGVPDKGTVTKTPATKTVRADKTGRVSVAEPAPAVGPSAAQEAAAGA